MSNEFVCTMCHGTFEKNRSDAEADQEAEERFGAPIPEPERAIVCDDCLNWMLDVERICRELASVVGDDPDQMITAGNDEAVPLWTVFMTAAKARTKLPAPPGV